MEAAYQIVLLAAQPTDFTSRIAAAVRQLADRWLRELGLGEDEIAFVNDAQIATLDPGLPTAAIYMSDTERPTATAALEQLIKSTFLVIPVVPSTSDFRKWVPEPLYAINGLAPAAAGDYEGVAATVTTRIFEELRLLRRARHAFISYKRRESSAAAEQLHEALERRRYEVFLDTFSVDYGLDFQSVLWDTMARADLVVLLNTKTAFDSVWVEQEISRANVSGLGVLQLLWPEVSPVERPRGTELAEPMYLCEADFEAPYSTSALAKLTARALERVLTQSERLRARAQATRRRRVIAELIDTASRHGLDVALDNDSMARITIPPRSPGSVPAAGAAAPLAAPTGIEGTALAKSRVLLPLVGPPDAEILHDYWLHGEKVKRDAVLVYDALGVLSRRNAHLLWLDQHLPQKAVSVQEIGTWFKRNVL